MSAFDTQVGGDHYKRMAIQPMQYNIRNRIPFAEGSVIKYVSRWRSKGGVVDLHKARQVLDQLIEEAEAEEKNSATAVQRDSAVVPDKYTNVLHKHPGDPYRILAIPGFRTAANARPLPCLAKQLDIVTFWMDGELHERDVMRVLRNQSGVQYEVCAPKTGKPLNIPHHHVLRIEAKF